MPFTWQEIMTQSLLLARIFFIVICFSMSSDCTWLAKFALKWQAYTSQMNCVRRRLSLKRVYRSLEISEQVKYKCN